MDRGGQRYYERNIKVIKIKMALLMSPVFEETDCHRRVPASQNSLGVKVVGGDILTRTAWQLGPGL